MKQPAWLTLDLIHRVVCNDDKGWLQSEHIPCSRPTDECVHVYYLLTGEIARMTEDADAWPVPDGATSVIAREEPRGWVIPVHVGDAA